MHDSIIGDHPVPPRHHPPRNRLVAPRNPGDSDGRRRFRQARRRAAGITIVGLAVGATMLWLAGPASAATTTHLAETWNPLTGIKPDFTLFGPTVGTTWRRCIGAFWAVCLGVCAIWVVSAGVKMAAANRRGMAVQQVDAKASLQDALIGFGCCAGASIIIAGIIFAMGV